MKYYVYELVSSLTGKVFYIGKGAGCRMYQHEKEARKPGNTYKLNTIRKIWRDGGKVICNKIGLFVDEVRAYEFESLQIKTTDGLTNACKQSRVIPEDTVMGRRMLSALIVAQYWPIKGYKILLKLLDENDILTLHRQQAYMVKTYGE